MARGHFTDKDYRNEVFGYKTDLILRAVTDFCWMSSYEIFLAMEVLYEDVNQSGISAHLNRLVKEGRIVTKPAPRTYGKHTKLLYMRAT